jgi:hypothetical protein
MARKAKALPPNRFDVKLVIAGDYDTTVDLGTIETAGSILEDLPGKLREAADRLERTRVEALEG